MGRLVKALSGSIAYNAEAKTEFEAAARQALRKVYHILKLRPEGGNSIRPTISFNPGGMAVSGEVTLHSDGLYVQVSESYGGKGNEVLFRFVRSRTDYTGGRNHWASAAELEDAKTFAKRLIRVLEEER